VTRLVFHVGHNSDMYISCADYHKQPHVISARWGRDPKIWEVHTRLQLTTRDKEKYGKQTRNSQVHRPNKSNETRRRPNVIESNSVKSFQYVICYQQFYTRIKETITLEILCRQL